MLKRGLVTQDYIETYITLRASQAPALQLMGGLWSIHHSFLLDENTSATTSLTTLIFTKSNVIT